MMYKASGNTMYQLGSSVFAKSFELQQECVSIGIYCPNWSSSTKSMTLTLYKWDTDYTTTLASTPVNSRHFTSYGDNSRLQIFADKAADGSTKIPAGKIHVDLDGKNYERRNLEGNKFRIVQLSRFLC